MLPEAAAAGAASLKEQSAPPDPLQVGRYQIVEEIGDGAMGRVWRGFDPELGRAVAIKTVKSEYLTRDTREEYLHRFRREARAAGLLSHPNIVRIHDVGDDYFVMELVEGVTLADLLKHKGRLDVAEALALLGPLAEAIDEAHRAGVIHRDIKPANIMVQPDGRPKLMDFGVARVEASAATAAGHFFGSPSYMAPEQIAGGEVTARSDLYSFAVVAYETLTGQRPVQGEGVTAVMYRVVHEPVPPPRSVLPDLPAQFDDVFRCALAKAPGRRFPSAGSFVAALRGEDVESLLAPLLAGLPGEEAPAARASVVETHDLPGLPVTRRTGAGRRLLWPAAAAAVAVVAVALSAPLLLPTALARRTSLQVETEPRDAEVWMDGQRAGRSPVLLRSLRRGSHRLRVSQEGYAPAELLLQVSDGMGLVPLRFSLAPLTAALEIRTQEGVTVSLDGKAVGVAPLPPMRLSPGVHEVRLERTGFVPQVHERQARAGDLVVIDGQLVAAPSQASHQPPSPPPFWTDHREPAELATPPPRISGEPAEYPEQARRLQLEGSVLVEIAIEADGRVGYVRVLESAGSILDQAVLDAVSGWRFEPPRVDGRPSRVRWKFRQTFRPR